MEVKESDKCKNLINVYSALISTHCKTHTIYGFLSRDGDAGCENAEEKLLERFQKS